MGFVSFERPRRRAGEAVLRFVVAALTSLLLVALAGLTVVEVRPAWLAGLRNAGPLPAPIAALPGAAAVPQVSPGQVAAPSAPGTPGTPSARQRVHAALHTRPVDDPAGKVPRLVALRPASGTAGQHLTVSGANLFSANGRITLRFDGQAAPVRCPSTQRCIATVPRLGSSGHAARVTLRTTSGRSNALSFDYR